MSSAISHKLVGAAPDSIIGKGMDLANNGKATADVRLIELGDIKKMSDSFGETEKLHDSFIYIAEGGRILGVKIR